MSVPTNFKAAIAGRAVKHFRWLEIEGLPYGYGDKAQGASWMLARPTEERLLGIRPYLTGLPDNEDSDIDVLDGLATTVGSVDFHIGDHDLLPTQWTGVHNDADWVLLAADVTAESNVLSYTGDGSALPGNGTLYIGTETVTYGTHDPVNKQLTRVTRGKYRSRAKAWGAGIPLSLRPYSMKGRRCWYFQCATSGGAFVDADKATRFVGTLEKFRLDDSTPGAFVVTAESLEREMTRDVFTGLRTLAGPAPISAPGGEGSGMRLPGESGYSAQFPNDRMTSPDAEKFKGDDHPFLIRVDDEVLLFAYNAGSIQMLARGLFGTQAVAHDANWNGQEVAGIALYATGATALPENTSTRFSSLPTTDSPAPNNHPLMLLLQVLLSTGEGTNYDPSPGARNYDVLPSPWGLGIDLSRVDVAGIEKLAAESPDLQFGGLVEEASSAVDFAKACLAPFGYYGVSTIGDVWTVRQLRPPLPDQVTRAVTDAQRIRGHLPGWDANLSGVVSAVELKCDWDVVANEFRRVEILRLLEADQFSDGQGRTITYEVKWLYSGNRDVPGCPPQKAQDVAELAKSRVSFFRQRFARPPAVVSERVDYSFLDVELAELVAVTHDHLPNTATGTRGLNAALGEVIAKKVDDKSKVVELDVLMTGYQVGDYRFIAPSLKVTGWDGTILLATVAANAFTIADGGASGQRDLRVRTSAGTLEDTFAVNQHVSIYSADFSQSAGAYVDAISGNKVTLADDPGFVPAFILFDLYDSTKAFSPALVATYAFAGDDNTQLGVTNETGHRYFP